MIKYISCKISVWHDTDSALLYWVDATILYGIQGSVTRLPGAFHYMHFNQYRYNSYLNNVILETTWSIACKHYVCYRQIYVPTLQLLTYFFFILYSQSLNKKLFHIISIQYQYLISIYEHIVLLRKIAIGCNFNC